MPDLLVARHLGALGVPLAVALWQLELVPSPLRFTARRGSSGRLLPPAVVDPRPEVWGRSLCSCVRGPRLVMISIAAHETWLARVVRVQRGDGLQISIQYLLLCRGAYRTSRKCLPAAAGQTLTGRQPVSVQPRRKPRRQAIFWLLRLPSTPFCHSDSTAAAVVAGSLKSNSIELERLAHAVR